METNHSDFSSSPLTAIAKHVADWTPPALVVEPFVMEMPERTKTWFADNYQERA